MVVNKIFDKISMDVDLLAARALIGKHDLIVEHPKPKKFITIEFLEIKFETFLLRHPMITKLISSCNEIMILHEFYDPFNYYFKKSTIFFIERLIGFKTGGPEQLIQCFKDSIE